MIYYNSNAGQNINKNAILHYLLPVLLVSIVATSPRFFEAKIETVSRWENYTDSTTGDLFLLCQVPNKRGGPNKRVGWANVFVYYMKNSGYTLLLSTY